MSLPENIENELSGFMETAKVILKNDLVSIVLFGSAVQERLRKTSDVNLLVVLNKYDQQKMAGLRESYRNARASINLHAMFICENELPETSELFAVKFDDIINRHKILYGKNPLEKIEISREARLRRVKTVLVNFRLRLREKLMLSAMREEQLIDLISENASVLRSAAASILRLEGTEIHSPVEALEKICATLTDSSLKEIARTISEVRRNSSSAPGKAEDILNSMMQLGEVLLQHISKIKA